MAHVPPFYVKALELAPSERLNSVREVAIVKRVLVQVRSRYRTGYRGTTGL